ncbi:hypothetical protein HDU98_004915, partial [Podochytrium sp. JEL0797]
VQHDLYGDDLDLANKGVFYVPNDMSAEFVTFLKSRLDDPAGADTEEDEEKDLGSKSGHLISNTALHLVSMPKEIGDKAESNSESGTRSPELLSKSKNNVVASVPLPTQPIQHDVSPTPTPAVNNNPLRDETLSAANEELLQSYLPQPTLKQQPILVSKILNKMAPTFSNLMHEKQNELWTGINAFLISAVADDENGVDSAMRLVSTREEREIPEKIVDRFVEWLLPELKRVLPVEVAVCEWK